VSGVARSRFQQLEARKATAVAAVEPGIRYTYYEGDWERLPDFGKLTSVKEGTLSDFDLSPRRQDDRFGFVYEGFVRIPSTGIYAFYTTSDDGSRLLIGDQQIVLNDGTHAMEEKSGEIALAEACTPSAWSSSSGPARKDSWFHTKARGSQAEDPPDQLCHHP